MHICTLVFVSFVRMNANSTQDHKTHGNSKKQVYWLWPLFPHSSGNVKLNLWPNMSAFPALFFNSASEILRTTKIFMLTVKASFSWKNYNTSPPIFLIAQLGFFRSGKTLTFWVMPIKNSHLETLTGHRVEGRKEKHTILSLLYYT